MPLFCIDFLFTFQENYLLLKGTEEPLKGIFWPPGGRLDFRENIDELAMRVQKREIGCFYPNYKPIGFSNYLFQDNKDSRALHTPTILFQIKLKEKFTPILDYRHSEYKWTRDLPLKLKNETFFFNSND